MSRDRLAALRQAMRDRDLDRALITSPEHVRYLSGFTGSSGWLMVGGDECVLITDFRYQEQAAREAGRCTLHLAKNGLPTAIRTLAHGWGAERVGYEGAHLTIREFRLLSGPSDDGEPSPGVEWSETERLVESLMVLKDEGELASIRRAAELTDRVFDELTELVRPGMTERELAAEIEYRARKLGAEKLAFPPIVASGPNAALPHAQPSDRVIADGDLLILDFGANYLGYASDLTRTVAISSASGKVREVYDIVRGAQQVALDAIRPGMTGVELDAVARSYIAERGYGEAFGHALGHGLGLRIHDAPSISWRSQDVLEPGMVFTIEPGIYLPGWGGVRIEDLVVVTETGADVLSHASKELLVV